MDGEEAPFELTQESVEGRKALLDLEVSEVRDCPQAAMATPLVTNPEAMVQQDLLVDYLELEGTALDLRVPELVVVSVAGEA